MRILFEVPLRHRRARAEPQGWAAILAAAVFGAAFLAAPVEPAEKKGPEPASPDQESRVMLERVIASPKDLGKGGFVRRLTGKPDSPLFSRPYGIAWDGDSLLITDPAAGRVLRVPTRGKKTKSSQTGLFEGPIGIAVCAAGIVVSDSRLGAVALLGEDLRLVRWLVRDLERPSGVACVEERILAAETARHRILVLEAESSVGTIGERGGDLGQFNFPAAIAIAGDSLWVGDTLNFRLQHLSVETGEATETFGQLGDAPGEMPRVKGIAVDREGNLWISDAHLDQVALYSPSGEFLMSLGESGTEPGKFSFPAGVAAHRDGRIAVVDSLNRRVQIFRLIDRDPSAN